MTADPPLVGTLTGRATFLDPETLRPLSEGADKRREGLLIWCNAPSRNYFCATEIAESKKGIFLFPLVEMLLSPKGTKPLEEF